jgi:Icc-related predicted phosphoesterase
MVIILLSDLHGNIEKIEKISGVLKTADLVLLSGDITHFGGETEAKQIIAGIAQYQTNILAVTGNCDYPEVEHYLSKEGISIHLKSAIYNGIGFIGAGGSLPCPGRTPNEVTEEEMEAFLALAHASLYGTLPFVLVVHHPPVNTSTDLIKTGMHVGSVSVRQAIEDHKPIFCSCGHIHEARGNDKVNDTTVINPGSFKEGNYALVKIVDYNINSPSLLTV